MKKLQNSKLNNPSIMKDLIRRIRLIPLLTLSLAMGYQAVAQTLPVITVRLNNPQYTCASQTYCLDVEFLSNTAGQELFGMNVRFFYDDNILELIGFSDFQGGYTAFAPNPPEVSTGSPTSGPLLFNLVGPAEFVNGAIQLTNLAATPIVLSTSTWKKIFKICFHVDDPASLNIGQFCPSVIWDLEYNTANGGYNAGDDGVVITLANQSNRTNSLPSTEAVVQFNWAYNPSAQSMPWGQPIQAQCISTLGAIITDQPDNVTICQGNSTILSVVASGGSGSYSYQWQYATAPGGPYNNVPTGGVLSSYNTGILNSTTYYKVIVTDNTQGCGIVTSNMATVTVEPRKRAGTDGALELCEGDATPKNLVGALGGIVDPGGVWTDLNTSGVNLSNAAAVNFGAVPPGTWHFKYTQPATANCSASSATVTVTVTPYLIAGTNGSLTFFAGDPAPKNLFAALTGGAELGGNWTDVDATGVILTNPLMVNFSSVPPGEYDFLYVQPQRGSCAGSSATVLVTILPGTVDLGILKEVSNAVPQVGESVIFTIKVTNHSPSVTATGVEVTDLLDPVFQYQVSSASQGTFSSGTGIWAVGSLAPGVTATLTITVTVLDSGDNTSIISKNNQGDPNTANNKSTVSVTVQGSSGGNDGGIESNGNLAGKIAIRNHTRMKEGTRHDYETPLKLQNFTQNLVKEGVIKPVSVLKNQTSLIEYLPESGPFKSKPYVSTPPDLVNVSNAREVVALDYFAPDNKRYAAILGLITEHGEVYNHTKLICDRLMGARLDKEMNVDIQGKSFILTKLLQDTGEIDYAVSFVAWANPNGLTIDSRWNNEEYTPAEGSMIYNFQVWSVTVQSTVDMVNEILARIENRNPVKYLNSGERSIPVVTVITGQYSKGNIHLTLKNPSGASRITVKGNFTRTELSDRERFEYSFTLNPSQLIEDVDVPVGLIFDAGFSVANDADPQKDALYFADGPWGTDYLEAGAVVTSYNVIPEPNKAGPEDLALERNIIFTGRVKDYASIFRTLKAGNKPVDVTAYNTLEFEGSGNGPVEVIITKRSINNWSEQFRGKVYLEPTERTFSVDFNRLVSNGSLQKFTAEDVESVVYSAIGNGASWNEVTINLKNLRFTNRQSDPNVLAMENYHLTNYPNPFAYQTVIEFELPEKGEVILTIYDVTGREIERLDKREYDKGKNYIKWENNFTVRTGVYMLKMIYNGNQATRVMMMK